MITEILFRLLLIILAISVIIGAIVLLGICIALSPVVLLGAILYLIFTPSKLS